MISAKYYSLHPGYYETHEDREIVYGLLNVVEESLEMAGLILFLKSSLIYFSMCIRADRRLKARANTHRVA